MHELNVGLVAKTATSWPLYAAESQGYFAAAQLAVTLSPSDDLESHFRRLLNGAYTFGHQNADHALRAAAAGADLTIFLRLVRVPYFLVTVPEIADYGHLAGRTVVSEAMGRGHGVELKRMLAAHGLDEGACPMLAVGVGRERVGALRSGQAAAGLFDPGTAARLVCDGFRVLDNSGPYLQDHLGPVSVARREWLVANRDVAVRYGRSYFQAESWLREPRNRRAAAEALSAAIDLPQEAAETAWELLMCFPDAFAASREVRVEELLTLARLSGDDELLATDPDKLASLVDGTIVSEARQLAGSRQGSGTVTPFPHFQPRSNGSGGSTRRSPR